MSWREDILSPQGRRREGRKKKGEEWERGEEIVGGRGGLERLRMFRVSKWKTALRFFSVGLFGLQDGFCRFLFLVSWSRVFLFSLCLLGFLEWGFSFLSPYFTMVSTFWWYSITISILQ
jgi:hypothetical protein